MEIYIGVIPDIYREKTDNKYLDIFLPKGSTEEIMWVLVYWAGREVLLHPDPFALDGWS